LPAEKPIANEELCRLLSGEGHFGGDQLDIDPDSGFSAVQTKNVKKDTAELPESAKPVNPGISQQVETPDRQNARRLSYTFSMLNDLHYGL
jgi:hypothetical protein